MKRKQKGKETVLVCCASLCTILGTLSFILGLEGLFELSITLACIVYTALGLHYYIRPLRGLK